MSWKIFLDNLVSFHNNPESINDIDTVAKKWADEYDAAVKRGGDTINKIKVQRGNKEIMEQLFKAALQQGLSSTEPYDLVGEMGKGVIAYWQGAIMQNVPLPIQVPPGATANVSVTSNVVINPGQWTPAVPAGGFNQDELFSQPSEEDVINDIDMVEAELEMGGLSYQTTEEDVELIIEKYGNPEDLLSEFETGFPQYPTQEIELISNPVVIDYEAALPSPARDIPPIYQSPPLTVGGGNNDNGGYNGGTPVSSEYKAILVGGLDDRRDEKGKLIDKTIEQQEDSFKSGYGNVKIKAFRYTTKTQDILNFIKEYPKTPVFMFSKGCEISNQIAKSPYVDKNTVFIIQPYTVSSGVLSIVNAAIKSGIPAANVYKGGSDSTGANVVGATPCPKGMGHWESLPYVAKLKSNLAGQTYFKTPTGGNPPVNNSGGYPTIYANVGNKKGGIPSPGCPPGYEGYMVDRSKLTRQYAHKSDGPGGSIPYEALRKVSRKKLGSGYLHPEAAIALELMYDLAVSQGLQFGVCSWYRDYETQVRYFTASKGSGIAAVPGHSNHGYGLAIDVTPIGSEVANMAGALKKVRNDPEPNAIIRAKSPQYKWLLANGPTFGWFNPASLMDGKKTDEAWHFEYHGFVTLTATQRNQMINKFKTTPRIDWK